MLAMYSRYYMMGSPCIIGNIWQTSHIISDIVIWASANIRYYMVSWSCNIEYDICRAILGHLFPILHGLRSHVLSELHM